MMNSRLRVDNTALRPETFLPEPRCFFGAAVSEMRPFRETRQPISGRLAKTLPPKAVAAPHSAMI